MFKSVVFLTIIFIIGCQSAPTSEISSTQENENSSIENWVENHRERRQLFGNGRLFFGRHNLDLDSHHNELEKPREIEVIFKKSPYFPYYTRQKRQAFGGGLGGGYAGYGGSPLSNNYGGFFRFSYKPRKNQQRYNRSD